MAFMHTNRLLIVALTPLLVANASLWLVYTHRPLVAIGWLFLLWASWRFLAED